MATTISELKTRVDKANELGRINLGVKGVETTGKETTFQLMQKIAEIVSHDNSESDESGETTVIQTKKGIFTIDTNATTPIITHKCGFVPTLFIVYPISEYVEGDQMILGCIVTNTDYFSNIPSITNTANAILEIRATGITWNYSGTKDAILTENTATLGYAVNSRLWRAGFEYGWVAIG